MKVQKKQKEDTFKKKKNQKKIEFYALKIVFTEEPWQQYLQVVQKK